MVIIVIIIIIVVVFVRVFIVIIVIIIIIVGGALFRKEPWVYSEGCGVGVRMGGRLCIAGSRDPCFGPKSNVASY